MVVNAEYYSVPKANKSYIRKSFNADSKNATVLNISWIQKKKKAASKIYQETPH